MDALCKNTTYFGGNMCYKLSKNVVLRKIDNSTIYICKSNSDEVYTFEGIGAEIFNMLIEGMSFQTIINELETTYSGTQSVEIDIEEFINDLYNEKIIDIITP